MKIQYTKIVAILFVAVAFTSCNDKTKPQVQFMPDMYTSVAYEPYGENTAFANGMDSQSPVEGTLLEDKYLMTIQILMTDMKRLRKN